MRHELSRITGTRFHGVLAGHPHIPAQRNGAYAVVGFTLAKSRQPGAKSNRKHLDPHTKPFGHGVVAKLMYQDHDSKHYSGRRDRDQKVRHKLEVTLRVGLRKPSA